MADHARGGFKDIDNIAKLDVDRYNRTGIPEAIYGEGKSNEHLRRIVWQMLESTGRAIVTRLDKRQINMLLRSKPANVKVKIFEDARILVAKRNDFKSPPKGGSVGIVTAGTSDIPVAEEARVIAEEMGCRVICDYDVGVAGIHRTVSALKKMEKGKVDLIIVAAGREGALASVMAGATDTPIIGLPTSVGYGFGAGVSALTSMLQSCALGLAVVNIDSGVGAGAVASILARKIAGITR
jgi:NCAIR mutase (PurE)-related protein